MANPGMPLLSLEAPGAYVATAMVPETQIMHVQKGENVEVTIKSTNVSIPGVISEVSISSQNTGGQYFVKIDLKETKDVQLYSGMFVSTNFPIKNGESTTILVPKNALIQKGQLTGIYTVSQSNTAILRWLRLGKTYGDNVEVLTGLNKDEKYIASAEGNLFNGVKLNLK
jgi:multidrug efflux pump subunit AcrA (membrane-fusion protein)